MIPISSYWLRTWCGRIWQDRFWTSRSSFLGSWRWSLKDNSHQPHIVVVSFASMLYISDLLTIRTDLSQVWYPSMVTTYECTVHCLRFGFARFCRSWSIHDLIAYREPLHYGRRLISVSRRHFRDVPRWSRIWSGVLPSPSLDPICNHPPVRPTMDDWKFHHYYGTSQCNSSLLRVGRSRQSGLSSRYLPPSMEA